MASQEWSPPPLPLSKICFWNTALKKRGRKKKQQHRPRQTRAGLAAPGALFECLNTFYIWAGDAYKTRARLVCALNVEKRCKTTPNAAFFVFKEAADNSRVCCARGFAALHLVYCSYCKQRSRRPRHPWRRYRHRLQYPVLNAAQKRLTEEQTGFHSTFNRLDWMELVLPTICWSTSDCCQCARYEQHFYDLASQMRCTLSPLGFQLGQKSVVFCFAYLHITQI